MRRIFSDLGTMCLGVTAILIAGVIISIGKDAGPQSAPVIGFVVLGVTGVILRMLGRDAGGSANGSNE